MLSTAARASVLANIPVDDMDRAMRLPSTRKVVETMTQYPGGVVAWMWRYFGDGMYFGDRDWCHRHNGKAAEACVCASFPPHHMMTAYMDGHGRREAAKLVEDAFDEARLWRVAAVGAIGQGAVEAVETPRRLAFRTSLHDTADKILDNPARGAMDCIAYAALDGAPPTRRSGRIAGRSAPPPP